MKNLHEGLGRLVGPDSPVTEEQAAADLARGRRALSRRRIGKAAGAAVFVVAAVVAYGVTGHSSEKAPVVAQQPATVTTQLVAYTGEQPKGYTIDKVPAGWELQGVSDVVLVIAPIGDKDRSIDSFEGKIAVMLQSKDENPNPVGTAVTVGGAPGVLTSPQDMSGGKTLWVKQPSGIYLIIQIWDATGWTDSEIVAFGASIHVLKGAQQGVG